MDSNFWVEVFDSLTPSALMFAATLKAFFVGGIGAYIFISASDYSEDENKRILIQVVNNWKDKLKYSSIGGVLSLLVQIGSGEERFLIVQAITVGATWPYFIRKLSTKSAVNEFIDSGEDVPVEESND